MLKQKSVLMGSQLTPHIDSVDSSNPFKRHPTVILKAFVTAAYSIPNLKYTIKIAYSIILSTDTAIFTHILILTLPHILR